MAGAVSTQHPAVVLRSHYVHMRTLLAASIIAMTGLAIAVVVLATADDRTIVRSAPAITLAPESTLPTARADRGPEEGTRSLGIGSTLTGRPDGGPEEGTARLSVRTSPPSVPATGRPEEGTARLSIPASPPAVPATGRPEEGSRSLMVSPRAPAGRADGGPEEGAWSVAR